MEYLDSIKEEKEIDVKPNQMRKIKEERTYVKSNKGTKIELKNLDQIKLIEESGILDEWTGKKLSEIKNITFKNNVFDIEEKKLVSSIRLVKTSKLGRKVTPMVWEYYKNRGNLDVNQIIKKYSRENLIIYYSICPQKSNKIISNNDNIPTDNIINS
jgi:hypothetical protein